MKRAFFTALLVITVLLLGCSTGTTEKTLKTAVDDYNRTLLTVLRSGSAELLNSVATEREVRRMDLFLNYLNEEKKIIKADLQSIKFVSVQIKEASKAEVQTKEIWNYTYLAAANQKVIEGPMKIMYDTTYSLVKRDKKWVVDSVKFRERKM